MLIKVVSLFLIVIVALAVFGRLRLPRGRQLAARRCPGCGRPRIGKGACACGRS